ncbi:hypothetical protein BRADI_4g02482v3 [Brachypodium distachyon]|uniref:Uncharacterized protein n=1 Tax=Brachypodium distachyon TaxID=15368 RepID=A0A2K2CK15_BRADI|nr:hypothetical protein BRADI_4g02482v3 [Brachypodium distachyon]
MDAQKNNHRSENKHTNSPYVRVYVRPMELEWFRGSRLRD